MRSLIAYRQDVDGVSLQLFEGDDEEFYVKYKEEILPIEIDYRVMPKGTYNQETSEIPYIVLDNNVYSLESFNDMGRKSR